MSEHSGFILVNRSTLGPYIFVGCQYLGQTRFKIVLLKLIFSNCLGLVVLLQIQLHHPSSSSVVMSLAEAKYLGQTRFKMNKGNAKRGVSPRLKIRPCDLDL
jgi:hypothetical protein